MDLITEERIMYSANEEFIKVLEANGYKEVKINSIKRSGGKYLQDRKFGLYNKNVSLQTPFIRIGNDFIGEKDFKFYDRVIDEKHLRAIICIHKLSFELRKRLQRKFNRDSSLGQLIKFIESLRYNEPVLPEQISMALRSKILRLYDEVILLES